MHQCTVENENQFLLVLKCNFWLESQKLSCRIQFQQLSNLLNMQSNQFIFIMEKVKKKKSQISPLDSSPLVCLAIHMKSSLGTKIRFTLFNYRNSQKWESTLLYKYTNEFLTADRSSTTKYFWKKSYRSLRSTSLPSLRFSWHLLRPNWRHSESLNVRKNPETIMRGFFKYVVINERLDRLSKIRSVHTYGVR